MVRGKHRRDCNHGKCGWVGGNPRYRDNRNRKCPEGLKGKNSNKSRK